MPRARRSRGEGTYYRQNGHFYWKVRYVVVVKVTRTKVISARTPEKLAARIAKFRAQDPIPQKVAA